jgi:pentapeptide MXKDX repeat protein
MYKTTAIAAAAAFIASTTLVTAFYAPNPIEVSRSVQLVQAKKDDMKKDAMPMNDKGKDTMAKDNMGKKDDMKKDTMMKDDKMKK